jgi:plastocyanin
VPPRRSRLTALAALAALAVACSGDDGAAGDGHDHSHDGHDHTHGPATAGPPDRTVAVSGKALRFDPDTITVKTGETVAVAFTASDAEHDFRIDEIAVHAHAKQGATSTATIRALQPGKYRFYCSIAGHLEAGMKGELVVTGQAGAPPK